MRINGNIVLIIGSTEAKTQPKWCAKWRRRKTLNGAENILAQRLEI